MVVEDLNSSNGTYVNGVMLQPQTPHVLSEGDLVQFGINDSDDGDKKSVILVQVLFEPQGAPVQRAGGVRSARAATEDVSKRIEGIVKRLGVLAMQAAEHTADEQQHLHALLEELASRLSKWEQGEPGDAALDAIGATVHTHPSLPAALRIIVRPRYSFLNGVECVRRGLLHSSLWPSILPRPVNSPLPNNRGWIMRSCLLRAF